MTELNGFGSVSGDHTYDDNGDYTVTVTDDSLDSDTGTLTVVVNNLPPVVDAGDDRTVEEGGSLSVNASFADPGSLDTHSAVIDWGDASGLETGIVNQGNDTVSGQHTYDGTGDFIVTMIVTDNDGAFGDDSFRVIVGPAVDLTLSPASLSLGIGLEDLDSTGDLVLNVNPNGTDVDEVRVGIDFGWRLQINTADIDTSGSLLQNINCTVMPPVGIADGKIDCVATGAPVNVPFDLAVITVAAGTVGRASIDFDPDKLRTDAEINGTSIIGDLLGSRVKVEGIVDLVLDVGLQAVPASGDNVRFDVGLGQEGAPVRFFEQVTGDQAGPNFILTIPDVRTDVYEIGITAIRDGGLKDTLRNLRIDVDIDRAPDDAAAPLIVDMGVLLEGNAIDDDVIINALDLSLLASAIRDGTDDPRVDFDRDGDVDGDDLDLICGEAWDSSDGVPPCANYLKSSPVELP